MATAAMARMRADRIFYSSVPAAAAALVLIGFGPSWFLRPALGTPTGYGPLNALLVTHGILMTAWMALAVTQPLLIGAGNRALHRSMGYGGAGLAAAIVLVVPFVTIHSMRGGGVPAFPTIYVFSAVNAMGLIAFAATVALLVLNRQRAETHKRLALLALIPLLPPALGRTPGVSQFMPISGFGIADLILVAGILYDRQTRGKVHRVWKLGGALTLGWQIAMIPLGFSVPWKHLSDWAMQLPV